MNPYIVILEDDHLQKGPLEEGLRRAFPAARIDTIATEQEFRRCLDGYRRDRPDVFVMDVMLRWAYPSPDFTKPPPEVVRGGYQRAGIRCAQLVSADPVLRRVPIIYYTILERTDLDRDGEHQLDRNTTYVRKSTDPEILVKKIRALLRQKPRAGR